VKKSAKGKKGASVMSATTPPMPVPSEIDHYPNSELVFGIVAPVGISTIRLKGAFEKALSFYSYQTKPIRLTDLLRSLPAGFLETTIDTTSEFTRINTSMDAGNEIRIKTKSGGALGRYAAARIYQQRPRVKGQSTPLRSTAHLLFTLKHPREVEVLRRIYGPGFFLVAVHAEEALRLKQLEELGMTAPEAQHLVGRDQSEASELGQRTRDTFQLADVFFHDEQKLEKNVQRFVDLVFGSPRVFPTPDEQAMFLAHAAALRSADLSRQVGAVVLNHYGDVIATGCNDVPRGGGGQYPGNDSDDDWRDYKRGFDSNARAIAEIVSDTTERLGVGIPPAGTPEYNRLRAGRLYDLTEFGRAVHAEMEAITCCARNGGSARHGTLFTTTFPCHNCAKHIVAAGIRRVVFVEPYPKSLALDLHSDAIELEPAAPSAPPHGPVSPFEGFDKVRFRPFVGVGARRYVDLFSLKLSTGAPVKRKDGDGFACEWPPHHGSPRVPLWPASYIERETVAVQKLDSQLPPSRRTDGESTGRKRRSRTR
jgi:deoxycytidylate deaminase